MLSCADPAKLPPSTSKAFIENARSLVLRTYPDLDVPSKETVMNARPRFEYYRLGATRCQFSIKWAVTSNRTITIFGQSDEKLNGARVSILNNRPGEKRQQN